ncbi:MAG: hypothetical protein ACK58C_03465 [Betaproteobacteria bacterium]
MNTVTEALHGNPPLGLKLSEGLGRTRAVAALFCRADSHYKALPAVDVWDEARDARQWPGGVPLVAHPPCRLWAKLRQFAKAKDPTMERQLAIDAVCRVQRFGGVLEHPAESTLWAHMGLPTPGRAPDQHGGWTAEIRQCDWGHKAEKLTWLYVVCCHPDDLPPMPPRGEPTGVIKPHRGIPRDGRKIVTKAEREHTPPALALWLVELARRCQVRPNLISSAQDGLG